MTTAFALEGVRFDRGSQRVLDGFDLHVDAGEITALLGPSGSGKTTVLRLVLGFEKPLHGAIRIGDVVASRDGAILLAPEERDLAVVFQDLALWPHLTVRNNLAFGLDAKRVPADERDRRIRALVERLGLDGKESRYPGELSGGERQRVAIARALALEPRAALLDEPLANLDVMLKQDLLAMFRAVFAERGSTVLYVTHDLREAAALADRIVVIEDGAIVQDGSLDALRSEPRSELVRRLVGELPA
jgi:iron(III) transport system ATP-binding protein